MTGNRDSSLGLYFSIPFCRSKCTYCNFASGIYPASEHERYVNRLIEDLAVAPGWAARMGAELPRRVDTVYLGGGTPTLLAPELIERLFAAMRAEFEFAPDAEITVECAPGQLADPTLAALVASGVNRVSLGAQSFIDREAQISGRLHNRATILEDLRRLRAAGIANLSVDLIAGLAGQTLTSWQQSLAELIATGVPHASIYMLEVDEDSRLGREVLAQGSRYHAGLVPDDDAIVQMYSAAIDVLGHAGLAQYEISNFCRAGFASRHNLRYWQRRPYLGLGLDASSMLYALKGHDFSRAATAPKSARAFAPEGSSPEDSYGNREFPADCGHETSPMEGYVLRTTTTDSLASYLAGLEPAETTWLSPAQQHEEAWFLGLRLNAGVSVAALEAEFGSPRLLAMALAAVARLADAGLVAFDGQTVRLTPRGQLLSNDVFQEFLDLPGNRPRALKEPRLPRQQIIA